MLRAHNPHKSPETAVERLRTPYMAIIPKRCQVR